MCSHTQLRAFLRRPWLTLHSRQRCSTCDHHHHNAYSTCNCWIGTHPHGMFSNSKTCPMTSLLCVMQILNDSEARFNSADLNIAYKMNVDEYQKLCPYSQSLEANWGKAPGTCLALRCCAVPCCAVASWRYSPCCVLWPHDITGCPVSCFIWHSCDRTMHARFDSHDCRHHV